MAEPRYYAGVGARATPPDILSLMTNLARAYQSQGWILRSGAAKGADTAFEQGCSADRRIIFAGRSVTDNWRNELSPVIIEATQDALRPGLTLDRMKPFIAKLMLRNSQIVLGQGGYSPASMLVCWTKMHDCLHVDAGGTSHTCRVAANHNIPIRNLRLSSVRKDAQAWIDSKL